MVGGMPVRGDGGARGDLAVGKAPAGLGVIVRGVGQAHATVALRRDQHQLLVGASFSADERLVDLHERAHRLAVGARKRRAQLVQPGPGCLVGAEPHDPHQVHGRDARAARADLEDRPEPHFQRLVGLLQQRAGGERRLVAPSTT